MNVAAGCGARVGIEQSVPAQGRKEVDPGDPDVTYQVVRRADGQVLRTFSYTPTNAYDFPYSLVGDDLVRLVGSSNPGG